MSRLWHIRDGHGPAHGHTGAVNPEGPTQSQGDAVRLGQGEPGRPQGRPGRSTDRGPARDAPSADYEIPAAEQTDAPAMAQIADAWSKPSLTTVDSMFAAVTQVADNSDAGSWMVE